MFNFRLIERFFARLSSSLRGSPEIMEYWIIISPTETAFELLFYLRANFPSLCLSSSLHPQNSREWAVSNVRIRKQRNSLMTGRPASHTTRGTAMGPTRRRSTTPASGSPPSPTTTTSTPAPRRGWPCSEGSTRPRSLGHFGLGAEQVRSRRLLFKISLWMHERVNVWLVRDFRD